MCPGAMHCYTLQHTATHCNTLQHTATHTATHTTTQSATHRLQAHTSRISSRCLCNIKHFKSTIQYTSMHATRRARHTQSQHTLQHILQHTLQHILQHILKHTHYFPHTATHIIFRILQDTHCKHTHLTRLLALASQCAATRATIRVRHTQSPKRSRNMRMRETRCTPRGPKWRSVTHEMSALESLNSVAASILAVCVVLCVRVFVGGGESVSKFRSCCRIASVCVRGGVCAHVCERECVRRDARLEARSGAA